MRDGRQQQKKIKTQFFLEENTCSRSQFQENNINTLFGVSAFVGRQEKKTRQIGASLAGGEVAISDSFLHTLLQTRQRTLRLVFVLNDDTAPNKQTVGLFQ